MKILGIVGSAGEKTSNELLLKSIAELVKENHKLIINNKLRNFPLFRPEDLKLPLAPAIATFKTQLKECDAIIISTPEYTHNIPAVLKNAFEWITASGELTDKKVLPITFTPHEPRGKYAMESLLFSLKTMNAQIVSQLPLYKNEVEVKENHIHLNKEYEWLIKEAINLMK